jgi:murein DD-endopeptidase MepM/ murein hydrolase activator NlpD
VSATAIAGYTAMSSGLPRANGPFPPDGRQAGTALAVFGLPAPERSDPADDRLGGRVERTSHPETTLQVCPVDPPRHYVDDFGQPRYVGGFHRHQGIDIFAPGGTPIRAPFAGRATRSASWAGGLEVYLYGRQGFVFNAHLSRVGKLGKVRPGTVIGYVGSSGDAQGTHDHFEWHPAGGAAVDSFNLLKAACSKAHRAESPVLSSAALHPLHLM